MSYNIPKPGTKAADLVTPQTREILGNPRLAPTLAEARSRAKNWLRSSRSGATGLYSTCMLANDDIAVVFFGIRGAENVIWNFGQSGRHL